MDNVIVVLTIMDMTFMVKKLSIYIREGLTKRFKGLSAGGTLKHLTGVFQVATKLLLI